VEVLEEQNDGMFFEMLPVVFMETQDARMTKVSPKKEHYLFHFIISLRFHSSVSFSSQPLATHGCFQNSKCRRSLWLQSKKKSVGRSVGRSQYCRYNDYERDRYTQHRQTYTMQLCKRIIFRNIKSIPCPHPTLSMNQNVCFYQRLKIFLCVIEVIFNKCKERKQAYIEIVIFDKLLSCVDGSIV
jgi:hypothetical protein